MYPMKIKTTCHILQYDFYVQYMTLTYMYVFLFVFWGGGGGGDVRVPSFYIFNFVHSNDIGYNQILTMWLKHLSMQ